MGLFNLFRKQEKDIHNEPSEEIELVDIRILFSVDLEQRNSAWIKKFNRSIKLNHFVKNEQTNFKDRIGMNYLYLDISTSENSNNIDFYINECLENGVGISVSGLDKDSDWLFTYGDLVDYSMNSEFYSGKTHGPFAGKVIDQYIINRKAHIGQPSEEYLPKVVRMNISDFLKTFNIENVKVALIWWHDEFKRLSLAFNIVPEMFHNADKDSLKSLLTFISWYLPYHYDVVFIRENEYFETL